MKQEFKKDDLVKRKTDGVIFHILAKLEHGNYLAGALFTYPAGVPIYIFSISKYDVEYFCNKNEVGV